MGVLDVDNFIENIDERYGGPAKSVPFLCKHLMALGVDTEIHSVKKYSKEKNYIIEENNIPWKNNRNSITDTLRYSSTLKKGIKKSIVEETILHTQNQWNYPPYCAYLLHKKQNIPLICSIRGSMYSWSLEQYKFYKKFFWYMFQHKMFQSANCIHVTEQNELKAIRDTGIKSPIALISNGIDLEEFNVLPDKISSKQAFNLSNNEKYILFMSRIHPKKGLDFLVKVWAQISKSYPNWKILVAGPVGDEAYYNKIIKIINNSEINDKIIFLGMLDKKKRIQAYMASNLFVLPSHTENFGIVIAEALASGIPVITTRNTPWEELETHNCGWWINLSESDLKETISKAINLDEAQLIEKGKNGIDLIKNKYSWELQAKKMKLLYQWVLGKAEQPDFIFY